MRKELFSKNIDTIKEMLLKKKIFSQQDLNILRQTLKEKHLIAQNMSFSLFFQKLQTYFQLQTHSITSDKINKVRYTLHKKLDVYDFVYSYEKNIFFCMNTALNLQGYTTYKEAFIFYAKEQSLKNNRHLNLSQESIDKAYQKEYRYTSSIASYEQKHIIHLLPKHTDRYEVIVHQNHRVSSIHRVFVEMIVHVQYYGSFDKVIQCFIPLKDKLDVERIFKVVEAFDFIYPYFQLIGYALEKVGFDKEALGIFKEKVSVLNFYTQKNQQTNEYDAFWQIYYQR